MQKENAVKPKMSRNNRILTIIVCIFLSVLLLAGIGFGIYFSIEEANTIVRLENVRMDEGVVRVLASYHKDRYMTDLSQLGYSNVRDTETFWNSLHENGKTHGELYLSSLKSYIAGVAAGANLYLSSFKLSNDDKEYIKRKVDGFIDVYGSEEEFNERAERFGFNYNDFCRAMELTYTAEIAFRSIYGSSGELLKAAAFSGRCEEYLKKYSRVKVIYIADEKIFDEELNDLRDLTESERIARNKQIDIFKSAVTDGKMIEESFDAYLLDKDKINDGDTEKGLIGYYIANGTGQSESEYREIIEAALEMKIGEVRAVDCQYGVAFLCRCEVVPGAYANENTPIFPSFYMNAALEFYAEDIELLSTEVDFKDGYYDINSLSIPANRDIFVTSWK